MIDEPRIDFRPYEDAEVLAKAAGATYMAYTDNFTYYLRPRGERSWEEVARLRVDISPVGCIDFSSNGKPWQVQHRRTVARSIGYRAEPKALR